jgi:hypothetical protein
LLDSDDLKLVRLEAGGREIHNVDRVERDGQRADADLQRRGSFGRHSPAHEVLNCQSEDRQGLVNGGRLGVVTRIETQDSFTRRQQYQAAPERSIA